MTESKVSARPKVLLVKASDSPPALVGGLEGLGLDVLRASNCQEAKQMLATFPDVLVALTDLTLPDGNWRTVAHAVAETSAKAEIVAVGRSKLRGSVVDSGAYDLLAEPYSRGEVLRVVGGAAWTSLRRSTGVC